MKSPRRTCPPPILVVSSPTTPTCSKQQYHSNKARSREQIKLHNIASCPFCQPSTSRPTCPYSCASPYMAMNAHHPAMGLMVSLGQSTDYSGSKGVPPGSIIGWTEKSVVLRAVYKGRSTRFCTRKNVFLSLYLKCGSHAHPFHSWSICFVVLLCLPSYYSNAHLDRPLTTSTIKSPCICG